MIYSRTIKKIKFHHAKQGKKLLNYLLRAVQKEFKYKLQAS